MITKFPNTSHEQVLLFIQCATGLTPRQCEEIGLDSEDSYNPIVTKIYTQGCCGNFAIMLSMAFQGKLKNVIDGHHIIVEIDDKLYDATGEVTSQYKNTIEDITINQLMNGDIGYHSYSMELDGPIV